MKANKKIVAGIMIVLTAFWVLVAVVSCIGAVTYNEPGGESISVFLGRGIYKAFLVFSVLGIVSSCLICVYCVITSRKKLLSKKPIKQAALIACITENVTFYLFITVCLLGAKDTLCLLFMCITLIALLISGIMLVFLGKNVTPPKCSLIKV